MLKRIGIAMIGLLGLTLSAGVLTAQDTPQQTAVELPKEFAENFNRFDPALWSTVGRGEVKLSNGALSIADCFVCTGDANWADYEISFRARAPEDAEQVQIWAGFRCAARDRRYAVALRGGNCDDIYLCRYSPGGNDKLLALKPLDFHPEPGRWYRLRVVVQGRCIGVYLDDEQQPRVCVSDDHPIPSGQVVLGGGWIETEFDDFRVKHLSEKAAGAKPDSFHPNVIKPLEGPDEKQRRRIAQRKSYRPVVVDRLSAPRHEVSLGGDWLFKPEHEVQPQVKPFRPETGDDDWHVIRVPAFWNQTRNWLHNNLPNWGHPYGSGVSSNYDQKEEARCENYSFDYKRTASAWYRHWITLPEDIQGKHFKLCFDAVSKMADVWVNGRHVGGHVGMFGAFELDITDAVKPGRNLVAVRVAIRKSPESKNADKVLGVAVTVEITKDMLDSLPHGIYGHQGGIWQPVKLVVTDPVRIDDVFAKTRTDGADVDVTLGNYGGGEQSINVEMTIRPDGETETVYKSPEPLKVAVPTGQMKTVALKTSTLDVKTWSPEMPNLYTLTVSLLRDGRPVDRTSTTIGFRTFEVRGNKFYLNGKPYWLRGASHTPAGLAPNDAGLADTFMKFMHDGNQMVTRDTCAPLSETWFDAADRQGVAVSHEGPWPWAMSYGEVPSAELLKVWKDEQASLVKQHRNHPSLVMYTMNNEMSFTRRLGGDQTLRMRKWKELSKIIRMVRSLDPTRPISANSGYVRIPHDWKKNLEPAGIDDGDIDDQHAYYGWYVGTHFILFDGLWTRREFGTGINPNRPYISQECSTGYPNNDTGHPTRSYLFNHYTPQAFVGDWAYEDHDPAVFLKNHALISKEVAEAIRRTSPDAAGVLHFANVCWFRNVYDADVIEPYPAYYAMKLALQPVLVSAELFGRNFYAGSDFKTRVCIINDQLDGKALPRSRLRWQIRHGRSVLLNGTVPVDAVEHQGRQWLDLAFDLPKQLPAARATCQLILSLQHENTNFSENVYDLTVARRDWIDAGQSLRSKAIGLFDHGKRTSAALEAAGAKVRPVADLRQVKPADWDLLVVADADALAEPPAGWTDLRQFAEQGGTVLLIHPGKHLKALLPQFVESVLEGRGKIVNMRMPESPVFNALAPADLRWWNVTPGKTPYTCRRSFRLTEKKGLNVLATYLRVHSYLKNPRKQLKAISGSPLFEVSLGKGKILVCEMAVEAAENDPVAACLLANMMVFLTTPK